MADMTINDSSVFSPLLQEQLLELPNIKFNTALPELYTVVNSIAQELDIRLATFNDSLENKAIQIADQTLQGYNGLKQCPEHKVLFTPLSELAGKIGENVLNVFNILKQAVKPEVDALKQQILDTAQADVEQSDQAIILNPDTPVKTDFETINWDALVDRFGGPDILLQTYKEITGEAGIDFSLSSIATMVASNRLQVRPLGLVPETKTDMIRRALEANPNPEMEPVVNEIFDLVTDNYTFATLIHSTLGALVRSNDHATTLTACINTIEKLYAAFKTFRTTPFDLSETVSNAFYENCKALEDFFFMVGYGLMVLRGLYKDALIISEKHLNGDTLPAFLDAGGTLEDIGMYLQSFHTGPNIAVPASGIKANAVLDNRTEAKTRYESLRASYLSSAASIQYQALTRAMRQVLTQYLQDTDASRLPEGRTAEEFATIHKPTLQTTLNQLNTGSDNNLENLLYDFIINVHYDKTMVRTAHEMFGAEMVRQLEASQDVDSETMALVDAQVAANIIAKFLMDSIVTVD